LDITPVQPVKNIPSATNAICLFRFIPASQQKPKIFGPTYDKAALMSSKFWKFCTRIKSLGNYRFEQILEQFRLVVPYFVQSVGDRPATGCMFASGSRVDSAVRSRLKS
jgi:hypothetical protein